MHTFPVHSNMMIKGKRKLFRLTVLFFCMTLLFTCVALMRTYADGHDSNAAAATPAPVKTVEVSPGDSLWGIARLNAPRNEDVRSYIDKIMKRNGLSTPKLQIGQILILP